MCPQTADITIFDELQDLCISQMAVYRGYDVYKEDFLKIYEKKILSIFL